MFQSELGGCVGLEDVWIDIKMPKALACREGVAGLVSNTSPSMSIVGDDLGNWFRVGNE